MVIFYFVVWLTESTIATCNTMFSAIPCSDTNTKCLVFPIYRPLQLYYLYTFYALSKTVCSIKPTDLQCSIISLKIVLITH